MQTIQKWEYKFIIAEKFGKGIFGFVLPKEISWKVHYVNGKVLQNWTDITLYNYLSEEGAIGWEVVTMNTQMTIRSGTLPIEHIFLVMKRPLLKQES